MSNLERNQNLKRSESVITWSMVYLVTCWFSAIAGLLNSDPDAFLATDLLTLLLIPAGITSVIFTWKWLSSVLIDARKIDVEHVQYRGGWAFWGWFIPIGNLYIPKRLVDRSFEVFSKLLSRENLLDTTNWWAFFVASTVIDNFSLRASISGANNVVIILDLISAFLLTIAFPRWKAVVKSVSQIQQDVYDKLQAQSD